eukprot:scaffold7167_cov165-Amphora_coffeaeformis.AAC.12
MDEKVPVVDHENFSQPFRRVPTTQAENRNLICEDANITDGVSIRYSTNQAACNQRQEVEDMAILHSPNLLVSALVVREKVVKRKFLGLAYRPEGGRLTILDEHHIILLVGQSSLEVVVLYVKL